MFSVLIFVISIIIYQPVNLLVLVVIQTVLIRLYFGMINQSLLPIIIFLVWVGGLLIIFLYLTSLINILNIYNSIIFILLVIAINYQKLYYYSRMKFYNQVNNQIETNQLILIIIVVLIIYNINILVNNVKTPLNNEL